MQALIILIHFLMCYFIGFAAGQTVVALDINPVYGVPIIILGTLALYWFVTKPILEAFKE